jgi:hypothetical protein
MGRWQDHGRTGVKVRIDGRSEHEGHVSYWFCCPGCEQLHRINSTWTFNGDTERPTFTPSILARGEHTCHSFITDGEIRFLADCTHDLAGQAVPLPELDGWFDDDEPRMTPTVEA